MKDTRERLLHEAERLIRTRGYVGFSFADLAELVGIRKASIHHHFATKEVLTLACLAAYQSRYAHALGQIEADSPHAWPRLNAYAAFYLQGVQAQQGCLCAALASELGRLPESLCVGTAHFFAEHTQWLARVIQQGRDAGAWGAVFDTHATARLVLASLQGALLVARVEGGDAGFRACVDALRQVLKPVQA